MVGSARFPHSMREGIESRDKNTSSLSLSFAIFVELIIVLVAFFNLLKNVIGKNSFGTVFSAIVLIFFACFLVLNLRKILKNS
jgi:hypothetical protein